MNTQKINKAIVIVWIALFLTIGFTSGRIDPAAEPTTIQLVGGMTDGGGA